MPSSELFQDLRIGLRSLRKSPGFTVIALATLALGIGANTAIFSFVNATLLTPLPFPDAERIVRVLEKPPGGGYNGISTLNYLDWVRDNTCFEHMAAETGGSVTLTGQEEPVQLRGMRVTARYFDVYGVRAEHGRTFAAGEDEAGKEHVVVISRAFWQSQLGGAANVIGQTLRLDGEMHTVVGVLPADTSFDRGWPQIWRPLVFTPENRTRDYHWFGAVAKLKPGVTLEQARAQMDAVGARIARDFPDSNKGWGVAIDPIQDVVVGDDLRRSLWVLFGAVAMVLLIGCANLANLMLARGLARDREVAIRAALGAGRGRLIRQFLTESMLLSGIGGLLGVAVGYGIMKGLLAALPPYGLPAHADVSLHAPVLAFSVGLAVLTGLLCGLVPALQSTRIDLAGAMKQSGGGASSSQARQNLRTVLIVTEVALACMLLAGSGLLLRSFARLQRVDLGFDGTNVLTAQLPIANGQFKTAPALAAYLHEVKEAIAALPGVEEVAYTSALPMQGWGYGMQFQIAGQPFVDRANRNGGFFKMVSPSYFHALGMRLLRGRPLSERDVQGAPPAMVISDAMAKRYFGKTDPIGQRILIQEIRYGKAELGDEIPWEVVGIVADEKVGSLSDPQGTPGFYVSIDQSPQTFLALVIRCASDPAPLHRAVRAAAQKINAQQVLPEMKTLEQIRHESLQQNRLGTTLLTVFAAIALLLAGVGIYGVISYQVTQRTREMGIRTALGATAGDILRLILRHGMETITLGLLLGTAGVFALGRLLSSMLFGVGDRDPVTLFSVAAVLGLVGLLACYVPARRATRVDPITALREE